MLNVAPVCAQRCSCRNRRMMAKFMMMFIGVPVCAHAVHAVLYTVSLKKKPKCFAIILQTSTDSDKKNFTQCLLSIISLPQNNVNVFHIT